MLNWDALRRSDFNKQLEKELNDRIAEVINTESTPIIQSIALFNLKFGDKDPFLSLEKIGGVSSQDILYSIQQAVTRKKKGGKIPIAISSSGDFGWIIEALPPTQFAGKIDFESIFSSDLAVEVKVLGMKSTITVSLDDLSASLDFHAILYEGFFCFFFMPSSDGTLFEMNLKLDISKHFGANIIEGAIIKILNTAVKILAVYPHMIIL